MTVRSPRPRYTLDDISYRRATWADHPLLKRYRLECGWGLERMERDLKEDRDTPLWIFSVPVRVEHTGQVDGESETLRDTKMEDVGMGGLVLDSDAQRFMADRESKTIKLCKSDEYQTLPYQHCLAMASDALILLRLPE